MIGKHSEVITGECNDARDEGRFTYTLLGGILYFEGSGKLSDDFDLYCFDDDDSAVDRYYDLLFAKKIVIGEGCTAIGYGMFDVNRGWTLNENFDWTLSACLLSPSQTLTHKYKLNGHIMTQPGKYRFETRFRLDGNSGAEYTAWIDFDIKNGVDVLSVHTFDPVALVYNDGIYSFVQTSEHAPDYLIVNDMCLLERRQGVVS